MTLIIILFGVLTLLAGITIILKPEIIFGYLNKHVEKVELYILAIAVRLALGVLLISRSGVSRFPLVIEVIGWFSIAAAVFFTAVGHNMFLRIMS